MLKVRQKHFVQNICYSKRSQVYICSNRPHFNHNSKVNHALMKMSMALRPVSFTTTRFRVAITANGKC